MCSVTLYDVQKLTLLSCDNKRLEAFEMLLMMGRISRVESVRNETVLQRVGENVFIDCDRAKSS